MGESVGSLFWALVDLVLFDVFPNFLDLLPALLLLASPALWQRIVVSSAAPDEIANTRIKNLDEIMVVVVVLIR
jgi:hypothetical protein